MLRSLPTVMARYWAGTQLLGACVGGLKAHQKYALGSWASDRQTVRREARSVPRLSSIFTEETSHDSVVHRCTERHDAFNKTNHQDPLTPQTRSKAATVRAHSVGSYGEHPYCHPADKRQRMYIITAPDDSRHMTWHLGRQGPCIRCGGVWA